MACRRSTSSASTIRIWMRCVKRRARAAKWALLERCALAAGIFLWSLTARPSMARATLPFNSKRFIQIKSNRFRPPFLPVKKVRRRHRQSHSPRLRSFFAIGRSMQRSPTRRALWMGSASTTRKALVHSRSTAKWWTFPVCPRAHRFLLLATHSPIDQSFARPKRSSLARPCPNRKSEPSKTPTARHLSQWSVRPRPPFLPPSFPP